jgi:hypothetical protein
MRFSTGAFGRKTVQRSQNAYEHLKQVMNPRAKMGNFTDP